MSVVGVFAVNAVGGYLIGCAAVQNGDCAVLDACVNGTQIREDRLDHLGQGTCGYIAIACISAEYGVAHKAANRVCLISCTLEARKQI